MDFKVGDKVRLKCCKRVREILCIDGPDVWLRCNDDDIPADEVRCTWELNDIAGKVDQLPTPPEGREVEAEMRIAKVGDLYWNGAGGEWSWTMCQDTDHIEPRYCLRPLPPSPEGDGWEWRKPVKGDEMQSLNTKGDVYGGVCVYKNPEYLADVRLGYRWCRAKPKVRRFYVPIAPDASNTSLRIEVPCIDTGTGLRLDTDKIGREWAIKWLEDHNYKHSAIMFLDLLRQEQEANNERD